MSQITHYQVLGLPKSASAEEIKIAFRTLAKQYHPDRNPGSLFHEEYFKQIVAAYEVLADKDSREAYDRLLYWEELGVTRATGTSSTASKTSTPPPSQRPVNRPDNAYRGARFRYDKDGKLRDDKSTVKKERSSGFQRVGTAAIVLACFIMLGLWLADINSQIQAGKHLSSGDTDAALLADPENPMANFQKAKEAANAADWGLAYDYIIKSKEHIAPENINRDWVAVFAEASLRVGQVDEVIQFLPPYLNQDVSFSQGHLRLSQAYYMKYKFVEAEKSAMQALNMNSANLDAVFIAAMADFQLGRYPEAIDHLELLMKQDSYRPKVVAALVDCYIKTQKLKQAQALIGEIPSERQRTIFEYRLKKIRAK